MREDGEALRFCLAGFLDDFYCDDPHGRRARLEEDPGLSGDPRLDALIGAIGEHLCHRWRLGEPPAWTEDPARFLLTLPWFIGPERMKGFLLAESPSAFRRRFIFVEAEPLRRARMPRDGRWWAYETRRSGLTPTDAERAEIEAQRAKA